MAAGMRLNSSVRRRKGSFWHVLSLDGSQEATASLLVFYFGLEEIRELQLSEGDF